MVKSQLLQALCDKFPNLIRKDIEIVLKIDNFLAIHDEFASIVNPFINSSPILIIAIFILILLILML